MEPRFGHDFSEVRVHTDALAADSARAVDAMAYTVGREIVFSTGHYEPNSSRGRHLLAHELAHALQQRAVPDGGVSQVPMAGRGDALERDAEAVAAAALAGEPAMSSVSPASGFALQRAGFGDVHLAESKSSVPKNKGEVAFERSNEWLDENENVKGHTDTLKNALNEIKLDEKVPFNYDAGTKHITALRPYVGMSDAEQDRLMSEWLWLKEHRKSSGTNEYKQREVKFFAALKSPLATIRAQFPRAETHDRLANTPAKVFDLFYQVADAELPLEDLYTYATREGVSQLVRDQLGLGKKAKATNKQLETFDPEKPVSGFGYLGADTFFNNLDAKREPVRALLPSGFDLSKATKSPRINERGEEVASANFANLLTGLQGIAAMMKRCRRLFLQDASAFGYKTPTREELVYWTYVYYNHGENGAKRSLERHKGKRTLDDWIKNQEFPFALTALDSYRMLNKMQKKRNVF